MALRSRDRVYAVGHEAPDIYFFGDDLEEVALEVVAVELDEEEFTVIHATNLRARFRGLYQEAEKWRK